MDGMRVVVGLHGHGTLAANMVMHYKCPCDMTLVQVDAVATTAAAGKVRIGTDADDDGYMADKDFGASNVPKTYKRGDFDGALNAVPGECVHFPKDSVILITVAHASMIHPDLALTFLEG
jgi:hypothetical protein